MLSIFETIGLLSTIQKWMTIFEYETDHKSRTVRYFWRIFRRLPIFYAHGYAIYDIIVILKGYFFFASHESVVLMTVSVTDLLIIKFTSLLVMSFFAIMQKRHLKLLNDISHFEMKWIDVLSGEIFEKRKRIKWKYNLQFILLFLHNFSYNFYFYFQVEEQLGRQINVIIWYIAFICQSAYVDYIVFYLSGYVNVFLMSLSCLNPERLLVNDRMKFLLFLKEYFTMLKKINALFGIAIFGILVTHLTEATTNCCFILVILTDTPANNIELISMFVSLCSLWTMGNIFIMLRISKVGDYFEENV